MATTQALKEGATLRHGTYRILRILGQGGFGITYLALDLNLDRKVAIKEFFPKDYCDREGETSHVTLGTSSTEEFVSKLKAKFLKEARNIAKFDNPGIIRIHAAFEENNTAYYVMDYIEGSTLSEMVKRNGPLPTDKALGYIKKVGEALEYVHGHRMNHLDVKPANIMVRASDDIPVLIDFGLSKQYDSEGQQTSTTPTGISHGYAPMEQYNDGGVKEFSPQTDLYSLAATLYYILSGVVPPQATKLVDETLMFPEEIPASLIKPIGRAMKTARRYRHNSIREFLDQLDKAVEDDATVISRPVVNPKPKKRTIEEKTVMPKPIEEKNKRPEPEKNSPEEKKEVDERIAANSPKNANGLKDKWKIIIAVVAIASVAGMLWWGLRDKEDKQDETIVENEAVKKETVTDMYWDSPLGIAAYTGEVMPDSVDGSDKMIPDGIGIARITGGTYAGSVYDGEFIQGRMEGKTTYTMKNGDTFVGTYKENKYEKGRYTIKETGEYFDGTFKDGNPDKGDWYDKNGNKL